jgi:hypothetical protein
MLFGAKHCSRKAHDGVCFVLQTQYSHIAYDASNMLNNRITHTDIAYDASNIIPPPYDSSTTAHLTSLTYFAFMHPWIAKFEY